MFNIPFHGVGRVADDWEEVSTVADIDRTLRIPLYQQIMQTLSREVASKPGMRIPSEHDLAARFDVSRMTVRQAITELLREGVLVRVRGQGTFAPPERVRRMVRFDAVTSLFADIGEDGHVLHSTVVEKSMVPADEKLVHRLDIELNTPVCKIVRLRTVSERPLILQTSYLPADFSDFLFEADLENQSMLRLIAERRNLRPHRAEFNIRASFADASTGTYFHFHTGDPVLCVEKISYTSDGAWFELADLRCAPDTFELTFSTGSSAV